MVIILMMSAKLATLVIFKVNVTWSKGYDIIIPVHDVTKNILMWLKWYCRCHMTKIW